MVKAFYKYSMKEYIKKIILLVAFVSLGVIVNASIFGKTKSGFVSKLDKGETIKIGALGTSLTAGTNNWFDVMAEWLNESYPKQIAYLNAGVSASASSYPPGNCGLSKVYEMLVFKPDVVFIEFAVNDAFKPYNISVEESRKNLEIIIHKLKFSNPKVEIILQNMNVVLDMPELNMTESTKRSELSSFMKIYQDVANKYQLQIIDHYKNWNKYLKEKGRAEYIKLVNDGIHPKTNGYKKILLPELKKVLN